MHHTERCLIIEGNYLDDSIFCVYVNASQSSEGTRQPDDNLTKNQCCTVKDKHKLGNSTTKLRKKNH
jgi:hypothetical protein